MTTIQRRAKAVADKHIASEGAYALQKAIEGEMVELLNEVGDILARSGGRQNSSCARFLEEIEEEIAALRD